MGERAGHERFERRPARTLFLDVAIFLRARTVVGVVLASRRRAGRRGAAGSRATGSGSGACTHAAGTAAWARVVAAASLRKKPYQPQNERKHSRQFHLDHSPSPFTTCRRGRYHRVPGVLWAYLSQVWGRFRSLGGDSFHAGHRGSARPVAAPSGFYKAGAVPTCLASGSRLPTVPEARASNHQVPTSGFAGNLRAAAAPEPERRFFRDSKAVRRGIAPGPILAYCCPER